VYIPVQVGRALANKILPNTLGDNTGDNISHLNPMYCELTATYWAWKNDKESDFIGICHYRRFFSFEQSNIGVRLFRYIKYEALNKITSYRPEFPSIYWNGINAKNEKQLNEYCNRFSARIRQEVTINHAKLIYAPQPILLGRKDIPTHFMMGATHHMELVKEIINQYYPALFPVLLKTLQGNKMCYGNMLIMSRTVYNEYCSMMFDVLEKHRQLILDGDEANAKRFDRLSGYIAEILTATFIEYQQLKKHNAVKYLPVINYHDGSGRPF
jgi:hypothetical protein